MKLIKPLFYIGLLDVGGHQQTKVWRRERDSNPRYGFPHTRFPSVRLQPLGHPSARPDGRAETSRADAAPQERLKNLCKVTNFTHIVNSY